VAAGLVTDVPSIVQVVFVGCLGLFIVSLATGALKTTGTDIGGFRRKLQRQDEPTCGVAGDAATQAV